MDGLNGDGDEGPKGSVVGRREGGAGGGAAEGDLARQELEMRCRDLEESTEDVVEGRPERSRPLAAKVVVVGVFDDFCSVSFFCV